MFHRFFHFLLRRVASESLFIRNNLHHLQFGEDDIKKIKHKIFITDLDKGDTKITLVVRGEHQMLHLLRRRRFASHADCADKEEPILYSSGIP